MISFNLIGTQPEDEGWKKTLRKIKYAVEGNADESNFAEFGVTVIGYDQMPKAKWEELTLAFDAGGREVRLSEEKDCIYVEICDDDDPYMQDIYEKLD